MLTNYQCGICSTVWSAEREPLECPRCASRIIERAGRTMPPQVNPVPPPVNPYQPPMTPLGDPTPVSSAAFSVVYWLGWAGLLLGGFVSGAARDQDTASVGGIIVLGGVGCLIAAWIMGLVKIHRTWKIIQPLRRFDPTEMNMPSPGAAVGLLFVPFYNIYWIFVAIHGLAIRTNKFLARSSIDVRPMNAGLALAICVISICSIIPMVGVFGSFVNIILLYIFIIDADRARGSIQANGGSI